MRKWINLIEDTPLYYHGSYEYMPKGTILRGRDDAYESDWSKTSFYAVLERHRPPEMLSHREAVFMCDNSDDLDSAGGGTEWVFTLRAGARVERHDLNWGSAISCAIDEDADEETLRGLADSYWKGRPSADPLWEYLTPEAEIVSVEEF